MSQGLRRESCLVRVRGSTILVQVGFVIKVAREALVSRFKGKIRGRIMKQLAHIDGGAEGLVYMTQGDKEYKIVK